MKWKPLYIWILGLSAIGVFLVSVSYQSHFRTPQTAAVAFVTMGLDQSRLPMENSSYEILRATEHFADLTLGWIVEPSFREEFAQIVGKDFSYSGQRQEKSNLFFTIKGPVQDTLPAQAFVDLLQARLAEYDAATHAGYLLAVERETLVQLPQASWRVAAGISGLFIGFELLVLFCLDYARRR